MIWGKRTLIICLFIINTVILMFMISEGNFIYNYSFSNSIIFPWGIAKYLLIAFNILSELAAYILFFLFVLSFFALFNIKPKSSNIIIVVLVALSILFFIVFVSSMFTFTDFVKINNDFYNMPPDTF